MIDKDILRQTVERAIEGTDLILVDLTVTPSNEITVEIDCAKGVDIEQCAEITRTIEAVFDRDEEDYELEVGSSGLTSPLKIRAQYIKNLGNEMEVLTSDGRKLHGILAEVAPGADTDREVEFTLEVPTKIKEPGAKKAVVQNVATRLSSADCKYVRYDLKF